MDNLDDYKLQMQGAALEFLRRHQGEHLHEQQLFERCCDYLVHSLEVPSFMAPRLADLALSQLDSPPPLRPLLPQQLQRPKPPLAAPNR